MATKRGWSLRIVVFGTDRRVGALDGSRVVDLNLVDPSVPARLVDLIEAGDRGLDLARAAVERAATGGDLPANAVRDMATLTLHAPAVDRPRIACAAGNYAEHTLGSAARKGTAASAALAGIAGTADDGTSGALPTADEVVRRTRERDRPRGFWKDFAIPVGPDGEIPYPARAELFDYEGEVVAIVARRARDVAPGTGAELIWGVSLLNDWSIRGQNTKDSLSFNLSKNFDGGASVGPAILVGDVEPADLVVETHVNGELRQRYHSGDMIFSHAEYLEFLSRDFTFLPGDMVSGGSGPGTATDASKADGDTSWYLRVGDVVEVSSPRIGVLRNRIVGRAG